MIINDSYIPHPPVAEFHAAPKHSLHPEIIFHKGLMSPKGEGKSMGFTKEVLGTCLQYPGSVWWLFRKDFEDHKLSTLKFFGVADSDNENWIPKELILSYNKQDHVERIKTSNPSKPSEIWFLHGKIPPGLESAQISGAGFDEADQIPWETVSTAISRIRKKGYPLTALYGFNPPPKSHWLYRFFVKQPQDNPELRKTRQLFFIPPGTNKQNLPKGYYDNLREIYTGDAFKRFGLGEWGSVSSDLAIWQDWRSSLHISENPLEPVTGVPIVRCWDFDFRAACVCMQLINQQVRILYPEVYKFNQGVDQFIPYTIDILNQRFPGYQFIDRTDPPVINKRSHIDANQTTKSIASGYGVHLEDGLVEWVQRQRGVNYFLTKLVSGEPCLKVDIRCEKIIEGFEGEYRYKENAISRKAEDVDKSKEHASLHDCIEHGCGYYWDQIHRESDNEEYDIPSETYDFEQSQYAK